MGRQEHRAACLASQDGSMMFPAELAANVSRDLSALSILEANGAHSSVLNALHFMVLTFSPNLAKTCASSAPKTQTHVLLPAE